MIDPSLFFIGKSAGNDLPIGKSTDLQLYRDKSMLPNVFQSGME
ncbi:hypothetical protein [Paenibacillus pinistramenti]|nr:hypothetical protein [Paenibacillus pinistramenti]